MPCILYVYAVAGLMIDDTICIQIQYETSLIKSES